MLWVIWILGIVVVVAVVGGYLLHAQDVGFGAALKDSTLSLLAFAVAGMIVSGLIRSARVSPPDMFQLAALSARLIVALAWLAVGFGLWRKRRSGPVLVDVGRRRRRTLLFSGAGLVLLIIIGDIAWPALRSGAVPAQLSADLLLVALGLYALGLGLPEVREAGVCSFAQRLAWERIRSYKWQGRTGHNLKVRPKRRWLGLRTVSFTVEPPLWHKVNDLFSERAPGRETGPPRSSPLDRIVQQESGFQP